MTTFTDFPGNPSQIFGIHGGQSVVYSLEYGSWHATVWNGPNMDAAVDIHPAAYYRSIARATNGTSQVGFATRGTGLRFQADVVQHAMVWNGTADSFVDLHPFLPEGWINSSATGIDMDGTISVTAFDYQPGPR